MIDPTKLKELVRLMVENDLTEIDLQDEKETLTIKRGSQQPTVIHQAGPMMQAPMMMAAPAMPQAAGTASGGGGGGGASAPAAGAAKAAASDDAGLVAIESPMVGTLYLAPNPDTPAFVKVGSVLSADTVVCLVEAMKVFNEIKAEKSGTIERVLVKNGQAVEFGQKLFMIRPA
jgi:acetyl-CoA carboxylase biotin carboxyl carrier protein